MRKSVCIEKIFLELPFEKRFAAVRNAGLDYIEFWSWINKDVDAIKRLTQENGLKVASMSGDNYHSMIIPSHKAEFLAYLKKSLGVANRLGCEYLVMHSNAVDENGVMLESGAEYSDTTKIASAVLALKEGAKMAEDAGVTLVIEAVNTITKPGYYMCTTKQTGDLARAIDSPRVKILYDTYHMQQMEGNMIATIRNYRDVLGYIHIGDVPERFEPGTGEINFDRFKHELEALNFDGIIGFELVPQTTSENCAKIIKAF